MRFVRNMPWLRNIFPSSEFPREGPNIISDDVQYTADYFGGGYGPREPQAWFSALNVTKTADFQSITIDTMPVGETVRILGAGIQRIAGNQVVALSSCLQVYSPDLSIKVPLGDPSGIILPVGVDSAYPGYYYLWYTRMVPGSSLIRVYFGVGDNTDYRVTFLAVAAPRGVMIVA